jgi:membrane protein
MVVSRFKRKVRGFIDKFKNNPVISFIIRVADRLGKVDAGDMAASIAYYTFLSVFPLLLGVIALLGLFLPSETVQAHIFELSERYLPGSGELIQRNIDRIIESRGALGLISVIGLFWTGSAIFGALGRIINRVWDIHSYRPFFIRKAWDIIMAIGIGLLFLLSMGAAAFSSFIPVVDLPVLGSATVILSRVVGFILFFIMVALLYRFMPNMKTYWRYVWPGAVLAAVLFEIARSLFTIYLSSIASYDMVYGSLGAVIVLLVWIYLSAFILVIGAAFSAEYGQTRSRLS